MNSSESSSELNPVPKTAASNPVPKTHPKSPVPSDRPSRSTTDLVPTSRVVQPRDISINPFTPPKNQRRYTGQTLKIVDDEGRVTIISDPLLDLALVDGRSRILDRAPWTGLPIQVA